jgi:hypothetical protein
MGEPIREAEITINLHDSQAALLAFMRHHGLLRDDPKGEGPKSQRELDEMFTAEIRGLRGPRLRTRSLKCSAASRGHQTGMCIDPANQIRAVLGCP